jgi:cell wall assembly regulator SMI1
MINSTLETPVQRLFHYASKFYPDYFKRCEKGYSLAELAAFEKELGFELPNSIKEFYQRIGGEKGYIGLLTWPIKELDLILFLHKYHSQHLPRFTPYTNAPHAVKLDFDYKRRFAILDDSGGSCIYLDFDPNTEGSYGQLILIFRDNPEVHYLITSSFEEFIEIFIQQFENHFVSLNTRDSDEGYFVYSSHELKGKLSESGGIFSIIKNPKHEKPQKGKSMNFTSVWLNSITNTNYNSLGRNVDEIYQSDLDRIFHLNIFDDNLSTIEHLLLFPNVAEISFFIRDNEIPDKVWEILSKTNVGTIRFITKPKGVIDFNKLATIESITQIKFTIFDYGHHIIDDFPTKNIIHIGKLKNLRTLVLADAAIMDISFLKDIPSLSFLSLTGVMNVKNWEMIGHLKNLVALNLKESNFSDFSILNQLPKLESVNLKECPMLDASTFSQLDKPLTFFCEKSFFIKIADNAIEKGHSFSGWYSDINVELFERVSKKYYQAKEKVREEAPKYSKREIVASQLTLF